MHSPKHVNALDSTCTTRWVFTINLAIQPSHPVHTEVREGAADVWCVVARSSASKYAVPNESFLVATHRTRTIW